MSLLSQAQNSGIVNPFLLQSRTMKTSISRPLALLLISLFASAPAWATCGGGGGGGVGGMSGGGGGGGSSTPVVYVVPWKLRAEKDPPPMGLVLYWFPLTNEELKKSSLRESRVLSLYSAQCVSTELADYRAPAGQKLVGDSKPPVAVLTEPDGSVIGKAESSGGMLKVEQVEKLLSGEMKKREDAVDASLREGRDKEKAGDNQAAIKSFRAVLDQKCMFPKKAKDAVKELKKLGVNVTDV